MLALIAEDNTAIAWLHRTTLTRAGMDVEVVENGQDAVEIANRVKFDVMLFDFDMPKLDGLGAIRTIRRTGVNQRTPAILCTGRVHEKDWKEAQDLDFKAVAKPIAPSTLSEVVQDVANSNVPVGRVLNT